MNDIMKIKDIPNFNISCRLVLKNIPENFSDEQMKELLNKNFEGKLKDVTINQLDHKYNLKNNKICIVTAESLEMRKKVFSFFSGFEMVDPRGFKQKINVVDCLHQTKGKEVEDSIANSLENLNHFQKFKEYFNSGKVVDFKNDEKDFGEGIFDGIVDEPIVKTVKEQTEKKPSKMIIMKKSQAEAKPEINPPQKNIAVVSNTTIEDNKQMNLNSVETNFSKNSNYYEVITQVESVSHTHSKKKNHFENKDKYKKGYSHNEYYDNYQNDYYDDGYSNSNQSSYNNYNNKNYNNSYNNDSYNNYGSYKNFKKSNKKGYYK